MERRGNLTTSMAALPVGALTLPVPAPAPAPAPAKFSSLFTDASKDPTGGNWDALMASFFHDAHNANIDTDTNALCEMVTASGVQNELLYFAICHGSRARLYSLCTR